MKYLFAAVVLASTVVGFSEMASAAGGCGPGRFRGPYGGCRGAGVVVAPGPVVVAPAAPVVVVPRGRVCPLGFRWWAGRCRPV